MNTPIVLIPRALKMKAWKAYRAGHVTDRALAAAMGISASKFRQCKKVVSSFIRQQVSTANRSRIGEGRPKELTEEKNPLLKAEILRMCGYCGYNREETARIVGCCRDSLRVYFQEHPDVESEFNSGRERANMEVENALLKRARGMSIKRKKFATYQGAIMDERDYEEELAPDVRAAELWLYNRSPDRWFQRMGSPASHDEDPVEFDVRNSLYESQAEEAANE